MIANDLQSLGRSYTYLFYLFSMIVNDLLQSLGRQKCVLFDLYDRQ